MQVACSAGVDCEFPEIRPLLDEVKCVVREQDRNLRVRSLFVDVRLSRKQDRFNGWAHPNTISIRWGQFRIHDNGWIQMSLGIDCGERDIIRLFAHELRHIGQFNRGKAERGYLTISPMTEQESEYDAYEFEERILDLM